MPRESPPPPIDGYTDLGLLGRGGMGEVRRVREEALDRVLALKVGYDAEDARRFLAEARVTAQLQHPGIVPVHQVGFLVDGRPYFTMREVRGRSLTELIRSGEPLPVLIAAFARVCDTLAYAHAQGVVHRDLKPDNILVGEFGEVLVVDWGLALRVGADPHEGSAAKRSPIDTQPGSIAGTPAYMAPEQALDHRADLGPHTDVWALGCVLYELLTGAPPFGTDDPVDIVHRMLTRDAPALPKGHDIPEALAAIVRRALARAHDKRYADSGDLRDAINDWITGADRRKRALLAVARADRIDHAIRLLRKRGAQELREGAALLEGVHSWEPGERKQAGWAREDAARRQELEAGIAEVEWLSELHGALEVDPTLPDAHVRLADHYRARHLEAERRRDALAAAANLELLRIHDRGEHAKYLTGVGAVTLLTDPEGASVECFRVVERHRRLVEEPVGSLGTTPLLARELPVGTYVLVVSAPGRDPVRVPVAVEREEHFAAIAPGSSAVEVLRLPLTGDIGPDEVLVPAGWFWCGGDSAAGDAFPATRIWTDDVVFRRFPVTVEEYASFLTDLLATRGPEEALKHAPAPLEKPRSEGLVGFEGGALSFRRDFSARLWEPRWPVTHVDWSDASAFAAWTTQRTGRSWRLPHELEWEKAARGVDRRIFAWGDFFEPSWTASATSFQGTPGVTAVDGFPVDASIYQVRGCTGNVREWCGNVWMRHPPPDGRVPRERGTETGALYAARGGLSSGSPASSRLAARFGAPANHRYTGVGFRIVRDRT
ncbi:MAG: SUMF1/EgtB/PvdO family nonheme iron enzyme [Deltaproteobacteria bacterium]|nr:SUMF1/EgtB/PvdO family nonheme iron enzyme [Deltaproteobacteria bacterium]